MFINGNNLSMFQNSSTKGVKVTTLYERSESGLILPAGTKPKNENKEETKEDKK